MPNMNGEVLIKEARALPKIGETKFVVITGGKLSHMDIGLQELISAIHDTLIKRNPVFVPQFSPRNLMMRGA